MSVTLLLCFSSSCSIGCGPASMFSGKELIMLFSVSVAVWLSAPFGIGLICGRF